MSSKRKKVLSALLASSLIVTQYSVVSTVVEAAETTFVKAASKNYSDAGSTTKAEDSVASITNSGTTYYYKSFDDAFAAAHDSDTIVLLKSIETNKEYKYAKNTKGLTVTVDGNGFTLTTKYNRLFTAGKKNFSIIVKDLTIVPDSTIEFSSQYGLISAANGAVTLEDVTIKDERKNNLGSTVEVVYVSGNSAKLTMTGCNISVAADSAYAVRTITKSTTNISNCKISVSGANSCALEDDGIERLGGEKVTIEGSTLTSEEDVCIYHPGTGTLTINNSTITGATGIVAQGGEITVTDSTVNATGAKNSGGNMSGGYDTDGSGIVATSNTSTGYTGAKVTVTDSTVTSENNAAISTVTNKESDSQTTTEIKGVTVKNSTLSGGMSAISVFDGDTSKKTIDTVKTIIKKIDLTDLHVLYGETINNVDTYANDASATVKWTKDGETISGDSETIAGGEYTVTYEFVGKTNTINELEGCKNIFDKEITTISVPAGATYDLKIDSTDPAKATLTVTFKAAEATVECDDYTTITDAKGNTYQNGDKIALNSVITATYKRDGYEFGKFTVTGATANEDETYTVTGDVKFEAKAIEIVDDVKFTITDPKYGADITTDVTVDAAAKYTAELKWDNTKKTFDEGTYVATVTLTPAEGCKFGDIAKDVSGWEGVVNTDGTATFTLSFDIVAGEATVITPKCVTVLDEDGNAVENGKTVKQGTTITIKPDTENRIFTKLTLNGEELDLAGGTYDVTASDENIKVEAEYTTVITGVEFDADAPTLAEKLATEVSGFAATTSSAGATLDITSGAAAALTWQLDGKDVDKATAAKAKAGTYTATVVITAKDGYVLSETLKAEGWTQDSTDKTKFTKEFPEVELGTQEAPAAPVIDSKGKNVIVVAAIADNANGAKAEYSIDGGKTWQTSTRFTGLSANTEYSIIARYAAVDGYYTASEASEAVTDKTNAAKSTSGRRHTGSSAAATTTTTTTSEPSTSDGTTGWTNIASKLNNMTDGSSVKINLNGNTTVPADVIKAIADNDHKVTFNVDNVFSWTVDGAKISAGSSADFAVKKTAAGSTSGLRGIVGTAFSTNGTGVPAELNINFKSEHAGKFANLYKKNADGTLTFVDTAKLGSSGAASGLDADAKGDYVVMLSEYSDLLGDTDNSGNVNALDASAILKDIVGLEEMANEAVADYNQDGSFNALDASAILKMIVGLK